MSSDAVVEVCGVSKVFELYARPQDRLRQLVGSSLAHLFGQSVKRHYKEHWALANVSLTVRRGEAIGIIGRNGSGKSTLLQIICGTLSASQGRVKTNGRVAALLELGAGFNPEFTGRENAVLTGQLLGLSYREVTESMDEVEAFADVGEFFDRPVKTYSSGMYVRVAFAASMLSRPDILVIDEALAVGDYFFQARCYHALRKMTEQGVSLIFVSHSLSTVKALCQRALVLDKGELIFDGSVDEAADRYLSIHLGGVEMSNPPPTEGANNRTTTDLLRSVMQPPFESRIAARSGDRRAQFIDCLLLQDGCEVKALVAGKIATIRAILQVNEALLDSIELGVVVSTIEGVELFALNSVRMRLPISSMHEGCRYRCDFEFEVQLGTQRTYRIDLGMRVPVQGPYVDKVFCAAAFEVHAGTKVEIPLLFDVPATLSLCPLPDGC